MYDFHKSMDFDLGQNLTLKTRKELEEDRKDILYRLLFYPIMSFYTVSWNKTAFGYEMSFPG